MRKTIHINIQYAAALIVMAFASSACIKEEMMEDAYGDQCEYIRFKASHQQMTKGGTEDTYEFGYLSAVEEEWPVIIEDESPETRVMPAIELDTRDASVSANLVSSQGAASVFFSDRNFYFDYETLEPEGVDDYIKWEGARDAASMVVAAFSPRPDAGTAFVKADGKYTYTADMNDPSKHIDIIAATKTINNSDFGKTISLDFNHMLTGVRFKMGFECYVKKIEITNLTGSINIDQTMTPSYPSEKVELEYSLTDDEGNGKHLRIGDFINYGDETFMMVPQAFLTDESTFTLTYTETSGGDEKTLSTNMQERVWEPGKLITYTVKKVFAPTGTIYFDLAAGNVEINASTYKGYHFVDGSPVVISGSHAAGNMYYVFQSATTDRAATGETVKPAYDRVTIGTQTWGEYITDNQVVEDVIHAWDDKTGATATLSGGTGEPAAGASGAVRSAGREGTNNRIHITGLSTFHLTIDNIYSTYMEHSTGRTTGGIAFLPGGAGSSSLTIYLKGDNRLGCIHYAGHGIGNNLIIENGESGSEPGTLTVADVDYYTGSYNGDYGLPEGETGYYGNHWNSAIGHNDGPATVYGLAINSGIIFAGTTKAENCTAIGAGGNGYGEVTINGGTVTAVASTTGTAIGGGIGFHSGGGRGDVTIAGGDVYAYNLENRWNIPSSAIGGAGSSAAYGAEGKVLITNGNVYAFSALGTAIGGGSSQTSYGGQATITITGGNITAKSGAGAGIGGGTGCSGGVKESGKTYNGGNAVISISGAPTIKTGSIGGGQTNAEGAYLGKADITVEGGDIQAQFIMEATGAGAGNAPSFTMTGGTIHNNDTASPEFYYISKNGGAVYMNEGTFLMTGGTIRDCSALQGGAVYICGTENPTFTMNGGTIKSCSATSTDPSVVTNGGGLYLENGTVTISGNAEIRECTAINGGGIYLEGGQVIAHGGYIYDNIVTGGNGGGICIIGGNFAMSKDGEGNGGNAELFGNTALASGSAGGNGGGIYVTATEESTSDVTVDLLSGTIEENSADRLGGGVCVNMDDEKDIAVKAEVQVGESGGGHADNPDISRNRALLQGGGLYVIGSKALITIDNGNILNNTTAGYVYNQEVANERGIVTLNDPEVTSKVVITFDSNNDAAIIGKDKVSAGKQFVQYVATSTNSLLAEPAYKNWTGQVFKYWHTHPKGDNSRGRRYDNGDIMNLSQDITLYAIW